MPNMVAGDIVLTALPQADGVSKLRPVLLLCRMPGHGDWLVCGISSQTRHMVAGFDELVAPGDADFAGSGLRDASLIRLGFLGTVGVRQIAGTLGAIATDRLERLRATLSRYLLGQG